MIRQKSSALIEPSRAAIPGGVNSPVRAFGGRGRRPDLLHFEGQGAYLTDVDGNRYIDYVSVLGADAVRPHAHA